MCCDKCYALTTVNQSNPRRVASRRRVTGISSCKDLPFGVQPNNERARWEFCLALVPQRIPACPDRASASSWLISLTVEESVNASLYASSAMACAMSLKLCRSQSCYAYTKY